MLAMMIFKKGLFMCFSAGASITAGVLLTFAGTETLRKVHKSSQIVFACIPLFFAFQQFSEGVVWLTIPHKEYADLQATATYTFLVMAQFIWPILVPLSVLLMEKNRTRKKVLWSLLIVGVIVSFYYLHGLVVYHAHAEISYMHINYKYKRNFQSPFSNIPTALYLIATLAPVFVSSVKRAYMLGIVTGLSAMVSVIFFTECLISIWCFFAAVVSFVIYYSIRESHKKFHNESLFPPPLKLERQ
jgi:hypothetical protein